MYDKMILLVYSQKFTSDVIRNSIFH